MLARSVPAGILWTGKSPINGAPIVAIVTPGKANPKTGPMAQVWILAASVHPVDAMRTGLDAAICGTCPHMARAGDLADRSCYVNPMAPISAWRKYARGGYSRVRPADLAGLFVRWGAYGDPAMLPAALVARVNARAAGWTGYTHQWGQPFARWARGVFMASADTPQGARKALAAGWGVFRVGLADASDQGASELCAHTARGVPCIDCRACDGTAGREVYNPAHGSHAGLVPAARLLARKKRAA